ncbi:MAG TPA: GNAT family N-acetyltransferase [Candidatus Dormibacteraeota bacterium]|jgi:ribosomal protein S18 acetylase RimI-like enzyme|nr:GNAT family N-acetyltransferase [Candidatus Dormibacteraeota bacterium]
MPIWKLIDLSMRLPEDEAVRELLLPAIGAPTDANVDAILARYGGDPSWALLGYEWGGVPVGCIGLSIGPRGEAVIRHIAVLPARRREGIGASLVRDALRAFGITVLTAETDGSAVGFYRRCGFVTRSLGELYPGVERFSCRLVT